MENFSKMAVAGLSAFSLALLMGASAATAAETYTGMFFDENGSYYTRVITRALSRPF